MHPQLLLLTGVLLLAPQIQPRAEKILTGPFGVAQQASLNQVDLLVDLARQIPPDQSRALQLAIHSAQRAHDAAVRHLIVVEFGTVTADYRRWKLRRAIQSLVKADREREHTLAKMIGQAPPALAETLKRTRERARAESMKAIDALRALDGGSRFGGSGATSVGRSENPAERSPGGRRTSKMQGMLPAGNTHSSGR